MKLSTIILYIIAIAVACFFPHTGLLPMFSYTVPVLIMIWLILKINKENFTDIGFDFKAIRFKAVWIGSLAGILIFCFLNYAFFPLLDKVVALPAAELKDFAGIRHNTSAYIFILLMGWVVGGFYEEVVFHGFIFTRIEKMIGSKYATTIAVLLTGIIFGLYHIQLGISGMLNAFLAGLGYHLVMLRFNRNIWYSFFAHGIFDTIGLSLIYYGYW